MVIKTIALDQPVVNPVVQCHLVPKRLAPLLHIESVDILIIN